MRLVVLVSSFVTWGLLSTAFAQTPSDSTRPAVDSLRSPADVSRAVEASVDDAFDDAALERGDPAQLAEILTDLADAPLDVNTATEDELALLPALSPLVARRIVHHRRTDGPFATLADVGRVDGVTARVLSDARPYLRVGETTGRDASRRYPRPPSIAWIADRLETQVMHRYERRLDLGRGYDDDTTRTTFAGGPARLTTRLRVQAERRVRLQLTFDKDPGEPFRWSPDDGSYGYDHVAGSLALQDVGRIRTLVVGDFTAKFGQGVALWRGIAFGKGRSPVEPLLRSGRGLVPFGSTEENRFFRGVASTVRLTPQVSVSGFASRRTLDASLGEADPTDDRRPATTLRESGLHRTPSEQSGKDVLREDVVGGAIELTRGQTRLGVASVHSRFDRRIDAGESSYQRFDFDGRRATAASAYATAFLGDVVTFGEIAYATGGGAVGGVVGVALDATPRAEAIVLARFFPRDFTPLYGYAFGERSGATQNEHGVYTGVRFQLARNWSVAGYVDAYRFPWLRFGVARPTHGVDGRLVVEHDPRPWLSHYVQVRAESTEGGTTRSDVGGRPFDAVRPEVRRSVRWHGSFAFSDVVTLQTRLEATQVDASPEPVRSGVLLYQDARVTPHPTLQLDARLAFFDTDGFAARVFAYEYDLLYAFAVPAFFGRGRRAYLLARYRPTRTLTIEAKYGVTRFEDVTTVGSGLNEVDGNRVRDLGVQVRWRVGG